MKNIIWITADFFVDVDLPVLPLLAEKYNIKWFVVISKSNKLNYFDYIRDKLKGVAIEIVFCCFKSRIRSPYLFVEYLQLVSKIKNEKADLLYVDLPGFPYFLPLLKLYLGKERVIIATHNVSTPKGAVNERFARLYMKFTLESFNNFHVFSRSQERILLKNYSDKKVLFAPLALKDYGSSVLNKNEIITFLNFGIIRNYKRVDILIEAANRAYEISGKQFNVKIAGFCQNWDIYQKLIKYPFLFDLKIESIPNNEVADLFSASHYFVLPYQDIAQSGALAVAYNYNIPVIASDLEAFKEYIDHGNTGFLFETSSIDALTEVMVFVLENHDKIYTDLIKNQGRFIEDNFNIGVIAKKYTDFFESLL